jgi:hypothetical protein
MSDCYFPDQHGIEKAGVMEQEGVSDAQATFAGARLWARPNPEG